MYALSRNAWKYQDRDRRTEKIQNIEYGYLAPDTINEIIDAVHLLSGLTADKNGNYFVNGFENNHRPVQIIKVPEVINLFKDLVLFYGVSELVDHIRNNNISSFEELKKDIPAKVQRSEWMNVGGQLIKKDDLDELKQKIRSGKLMGWQQVHDQYKKLGDKYSQDKLSHAYTSLLEVLNITSKQFTREVFSSVLEKAVVTKEWMSKGIYESRAKDYTNPFRKMVYETKAEMNKVVGKLEDNSFIQQQLAEADEFRAEVGRIKNKILKDVSFRV
jgi:hypothetical protein